MNSDNLFQSKLFQGILLTIVSLIVIMFVFCLGVAVGTKRANFAFKWAEEYHTNFGGPQGGLLGNMMGQDFTNDNGVFGQILKIDGQTITIKGKDNVEKNILVGTKTSIMCQRKNITVSDLKTDDNVVVIGDPNATGEISADLIRVMPCSISTLPPTSRSPQPSVQNSN